MNGFTQHQLDQLKDSCDWKFIPSASDTGEGFPDRIAIGPGGMQLLIYISESRVGQLIAEARKDEQEKAARAANTQEKKENP